MQTWVSDGLLPAAAVQRWSHARELCLCPRRYLRALPIRTRPSLFGD